MHDLIIELLLVGFSPPNFGAKSFFYIKNLIEQVGELPNL
jgi:hypothetical protein